MSRIDRRTMLQLSLAGAACACAGVRSSSAQSTATAWVCPPCGCPMHDVEFAKPGNCPACGMELIPKPQALPFEPKELATGSGAFLAAGSRERKIGVHYYKPRAFDARSRFLLVVPGAGRNGDAYRDAWIETAEQANVLVAALSYPQADYDFAAYHLGGVVKDLEIRNLPRGANGAPADVIHVRDEDISFNLNPRRDEWLFNDFDRIFGLLTAATGSKQTAYDMFGHSAGAQILHRLVLFAPGSRADRIAAANSGFYTLADLDRSLPAGLKGTDVTQESLTRSFASKLMLLVGEKDDGDEAGGIQIHTPLIDQQGIGRLARGKYFFRTADEQAQKLQAPFRWSLDVVPDVGHDFRAMSRAAARKLYG
ncbi:MAG TPA: heavy metal-binding domain-containing protein [Steroidobacteraceae bacterium]|nr:heavy metal-binding domain-containing protein [Steroidobacteraceae bacterium]